MRAVVKVAYFDNSGLHRAGEVVEVRKITPYLKAIEPEKVEKVEEPTEDTAEPKKPKKTAKKKKV